jgi:hypothetical protein
VLGVAVVAARPVATAVRRRPAVAVAGAAAASALAVWAAAAHAGPTWVAAAAARAATLGDLTGGSGATRLHIWRDSLGLIAARPWVGWGPDTFGLVFPRFATGDWTPGFTIDRAHDDLLQVAATQGLVGVAAQLCLLAAVVAAWWRGRRRPGALALLAAWAAYQVTLVTAFTWLPAAGPAWLLLAAAVAAWRADREPEPPAVAARAAMARAARVAIAAPAAVAALAAARTLAAAPVAADTRFRDALVARAGGHRALALRDLAEARRLAPGEAVYAAAAGDALLDVDPTGAPGPRADPSAARVAYADAVRLGDARPFVKHR